MRIFTVQILTCVFIISSVGTILSMGDKPIWFTIDKKEEKRSWIKRGNAFYPESRNFDITQILPTSDEKKSEIDIAFITATNTKDLVYVTYNLNNKTYEMKIRPYVMGPLKYRVKVKPLEYKER